MTGLRKRSEAPEEQPLEQQDAEGREQGLAGPSAEQRWNFESLQGLSALTRFRDQLLWASNCYVDTPVAMSTVRTRPWPDLLAELVEQDPTSPYLPLVRFIAQSDFSNELHGGLFLSGLHLSDSPDFKLGVHMLRVQGVDTDQFKISYFRGRGGFKDDAEKICTGEELVAAVDLFVKVKFGIALSLRRANG